MNDLVARWVGGDPAAAEELYRTYYRRVKGFAVRLGARINDAEDVAPADEGRGARLDMEEPRFEEADAVAAAPVACVRWQLLLGDMVDREKLGHGAPSIRRVPPSVAQPEEARPWSAVTPRANQPRHPAA